MQQLGPFLGIDPAMRHTGLCLYQETGPKFSQIDTETSRDFLSSARHLKAEFRKKLTPLAGKVHDVVMERQLSVGGSSSSLQFHTQMILLDLIDEILKPERIYLPLPTQLISYMRKRHKVDTSNASSIVRCFREQTNWPKRISQHCVDGYYLTRLGRDVAAGNWQYAMPSKETDLIPGKISNGQTAGTNNSSTS